MTSAMVLPNQVFDFFVIGYDLGTFQGFEFGLSIPPETVVLGATVVDNPFACDFSPCGPDNWIVNVGACTDGAGAHVLVRLTAFTLVLTNDQILCVGAANPSSVVPPQPVYLNCEAELVGFGVAENGLESYPNGCAVMNPTAPQIPIAAVSTSWGLVKSRFGGGQ